jgi:hypothetical protein
VSFVINTLQDPAVETPVDIAFSCLPLRSVGRLDVPIDASGTYRIHYERLQEALQLHGAERTYYLYDAHCVFHLANSEIAGMARFDFDGIVLTDAGDAMTDRVELEVRLASETCGEIPAEVQAWLKSRVEKAVTIEFNRFIAAGQLEGRTAELGQVDRLSDLSGFL